MADKKNADHYIEMLGEVFDKVGSEAMPYAMAKEKSNAAGKISKLVALKLEYAALRKEKPEIEFLR